MERSDHEGEGIVQQGAGVKTKSFDTLPESLRHRWGVILAGGDGTRLQPLTRLACGDDRPKQFCPLLGGKTLLAYTQQRISRSIDEDRMLFVLTRKHEPFYRQELVHVPRIQKVVQSKNQGTLPAILWSLLRLSRSDPRALVAFFPSDHFFVHEDKFTSTVERAFDYVGESRDSVVLLGASAERPETEYGWIEPEHNSENEFGREFAPVRRFWEKPARPIAQELLGMGCLWNTFVMVGSVSAFLDMIRHTSPVLFHTFEPVFSSADPELEEQKMQLVYDTLGPADFSREVLASSTERLLVANFGEVGWSDLGEPRRFIKALAENGSEDPWAAADICNRCGLTHGQIVTLSGQSSAGAIFEERAVSRVLFDHAV
mgnify:CR=1 FL=1